ncbi:hypothetical protein MSAN_00859900 [Mycena sanguinolenta]|uniref:CxC1-like cysteine cluster associated with KDZ transposases domain-containing protein n=1 Tax=Mycena sanguinolenta TaxID=230812 RepID=A0A8H7DDC4_9AGAR|nr:hypothetical protein MSAN_00859900 [Mycena sanguinolenta]
MLGGEFASLEEDIEKELVEDDSERPRKREDWRTRRDQPEMPARPHSDGVGVMVEEIYEVQVVDMFEMSSVEFKLDPQANGVVPALILAGVVPCAPWSPTVAIKIRVLEAYRVTHVRCPHLGVQSFVKSLCDLHGVPYRPYLCQQFSIAYDLYLDIHCRTDEQVMHALGRDSPWQLKHACPACTYKLEGEDALVFDMLTTMDGNDSLKRVLRREKVPMADSEMGEPVLGKSRERVDNRDAGGRAASTDEDNPCTDRWKNMINDVTSNMWGIFDETGIFLALCRHGFVLVIADMIKSGELAKYLLAVVKELLDAFGMKLGAGYDVGCHFETTVANSELGAEAREKKLKCLVGSFHGHAHNRLCQLRVLATYVEGMGLEDLEGCERFFSRSNGLAKSCRYASRFHWQQEITTYAKHFDAFETYPNLSKFLCNNYRQALTILKTEGALQAWMRQEGVDGVDQFHEWLAEEKVYLEGLKGAAKTNTETLEMEYVQKLVNLSASQYVFVCASTCLAKYQVAAAEAQRAKGDDGTYVLGISKEDRARRHAQEKMEKDLERVQELEEILEIEERWTTASSKWLETVGEIKKRKYHIALDQLELLIVERIFELTKMNQSQTGYKMRKHIAEALQARSKAVKNAIERYNNAAAALSPPHAKAELGTGGGTNHGRGRRYRLAMDHYFKILRAREEIKRLNIEIARVVTWIRDENTFLQRMLANLRDGEGKSEKERETNAHMAVQVQLYQQRRGRFDASHLQRFRELAQMPGFTGSLKCGVSVEHREAQQRLRELRAEMGASAEEDEMEVDEGEGEAAEEVGRKEVVSADSDEEDEGHKAKEEAVSGLLYQISMLAVDGGVRVGGENE